FPICCIAVLPACGALTRRAGSEGARGCRLEIGDTADWKSALRAGAGSWVHLGGNPAFSFAGCAPAREFGPQPIEENINDRRGVKSEQLTDEQAPYDGNAQRPAQFRTGAASQGQRQTAKERSERCHHDRSEAQQTSF